MDKLQELSEKLYAEGLQRGKEEGERLIEEAKAKADEIITSAENNARAMLEHSKKESDDYAHKVQSDLKMALDMSLQTAKKDIENLIIAKVIDEPIGKAMKSTDFMKEIIRNVAEKFSATQDGDIAMILPESLQSEIEPFIHNELNNVLGKEVHAEFSKKITSGFTIAPKDGGWFISMTEESFKELIGSYLRPITKKILFE